jgi:hypothetical protein
VESHVVVTGDDDEICDVIESEASVHVNEAHEIKLADKLK